MISEERLCEWESKADAVFEEMTHGDQSIVAVAARLNAAVAIRNNIIKTLVRAYRDLRDAAVKDCATKVEPGLNTRLHRDIYLYKKCGYSYRQIADECGCSISTVSKYARIPL